MTNEANGFLPNGYKYTANTGSEFLRLEQGDNKVRILSAPLIGRLWWVDQDGVIRGKGAVQKGDKPIRISINESLPEDIIEVQTREFWMMKVWNYKNDAVEIMEITQQTILKPLVEFIESEEWGDPRSYDINFKKHGSGKDTKYFVMPSPKKELTEEMEEVIGENNVDLQSFLTSNKKDAFEGMDIDNDPETTESVEQEEVPEEDLPF